MTEALVVFVSELVAELLTHTLVVLVDLESARTVSALLLQALAHRVRNLLIGIYLYSVILHFTKSFRICESIIHRFFVEFCDFVTLAVFSVSLTYFKYHV